MTTTSFGSPESPRPDLSLLPDHLPLDGALALRKITPADSPDLFSIIATAPDIRERVAWASQVFEVGDVVPRLQRASNPDMDGRFVILDGSSTIGYTGISYARKRAEYGMNYFLDAANRGRGYATIAVRGLMQQARDTLDARRFYLQIVPSNETSTKLARRLGFSAAETVMGVDFPVAQQRWRLEFDA